MDKAAGIGLSLAITIITSTLKRMAEERANWIEENAQRPNRWGAISHLTELLLYVQDISFQRNPTAYGCLKNVFGSYRAAGVPLFITPQKACAGFLALASIQ